VAFNEAELESITRIVGDFCSRHSPEEHADELRMVWDLDGHAVTVSEERPAWDDPREWMRSPVARFRFARTTGEWTLYWMRADLKWHVYDPDPMPRDLAALVALVDEDKYCAFFG